MVAAVTFRDPIEQWARGASTPEVLAPTLRHLYPAVVADGRRVPRTTREGFAPALCGDRTAPSPPDMDAHLCPVCARAARRLPVDGFVG
jgi:hypothetical protein